MSPGGATPGSAATRWGAVVVLYFAAHSAIRLAIGPALLWDESEAFYNARHLALGYGPQPPLYFWLQWGALRVLGEGLLALTLLKDALFAAAGVALARLLAREGWGAALGPSMLCLALLPVLSWEAQKAYTHSILALLMAVLATGALLRCLRGGGWGAHLWLGVVLGLGTLSKLNFPLWPAALVVAAALLPVWRAGLRPLRLLAALALAALLVSPVAAWMVQNPALAGASLDKLGIEGSALAARARGTGALVLAALAFWGLAAVTLAGPVALSRPARTLAPPVPALPPAAGLFGAATAVLLGLVWAGVLASGATDLRERWFLPVGWPFAVALAAWAWPRLGAVARRVAQGLAVALWAAGLFAVPAVSLVDPGSRGTRYDLLAAELVTLGAPAVPVLVSGSVHMGNLAYAAPTLDPASFDGPAPVGRFLLVVEERREAEARADPALRDRVAARHLVALPRLGEPLRLAVLEVGPA